MMLKLVIVEPRYQINIGYIARVAKNFGIKKLYFVNPRAKLDGIQSVKFSKHASELLKGAKVYGSFEEAISDCDIVVGTTGIWQKAKANFKNIYLIQDAFDRIAKVSKERTKVCLLIGRDDTGLTHEELERCDMIAYIGANPEYPVLNISHALAVLLFVFTMHANAAIYKDLAPLPASSSEIEALLRAFDKTIEKKRIRDKGAVKRVFRKIISTAQPTGVEVRALITALK
ncbi:MAG: RNA methyltransferase [Candidatus Micrarchaeia archaeon]